MKTTISFHRMLATAGSPFFALLGSVPFLAAAEAFVAPSSSSLATVSISGRDGGVGGATTMNLAPVLPYDDGGGVVAMNSLVDFAAAATSNTASSSWIVAFSDQGQNLAGIFFQASLIPYLLFLYFLSFEKNKTPDVANFGFQFVLFFVLSTIPAGIVSKSMYGTSLANVDWLHGGAELLLTVANVFIVWGLKAASTTWSDEIAAPSSPNQERRRQQPPDLNFVRLVAFGLFGLFAAACALGPTSAVGWNVHDGFLAGLGNAPVETARSLLGGRSEPVNALSISTWAIHFSSVIEYLLAMDLIWTYSTVTNNERWKGMTWGMLPLHASGICACTYHFFYNPSELQFLVSMQAGFTLLGNLTCAIAAYRIAKSNGWKFGSINPFSSQNDDKDTTTTTNVVGGSSVVATGGNSRSTVIALTLQQEPNAVLVAKVVGTTLALSYLVKYGSLLIDLPFEPNGLVALAMVLGFPGITAFTYYQRSTIGKDDESEQQPWPFSFQIGDTSLSMEDVKKYGVSGTVAYVLTELAFWIVAFPLSATALYQSTGHWPDVLHESGDRAAVLAFIFAGANVARLFVPIRLGAALALAPWVDENLLSKQQREQ